MKSARLDEGDLAFEEGRFDLAATYYREAQRLAPTSPEAAAGVLRVSVQKAVKVPAFGEEKSNSKLQELQSKLQSLADQHPDNAAVRFELARALFMNGDERAVTLFRSALAPLDTYAEAHAALGIALASTGSLEQATLELQKASRLCPARRDLYAKLGGVYAQLQRWDLSIQNFEKALRMPPKPDNEASLRGVLGAVWLASGNPQRGAQELEQSIKLDPKVPSVHSNLAMALNALGQRERAITELREALRLDDHSTAIWTNLGALLAESEGGQKEAKEAFERALQIDPDNATAKANLEKLKAKNP